jgi:hypothetical protein
MKGAHRVKICWTGKKHQGNYVCFIPLTIDGVGKTVDKALMNLEFEATRIIKAIQKAGIKCSFTEAMVKGSVKESSWWNKEASTHKKRKR